MELRNLVFFTLLLIFSSCQSDTSSQDSAENGVVESPAEPESAQQDPERDPGTVYVDTEYLPFSRGVASFADRITGRTIKYHQFDLNGGEIIDIRISSASDQSIVSFFGPEGQRFIRQQFGGPEGDFTWNERFNESGKYTLQVSLVHEFAVEGGSSSYDLEVRKIEN